MMPTQSELFIEIAQRNADYADAIDSGNFAAWVDMFTDDALYLAQPRENFDRDLPLATIRCEGRGMLLDRVIAIQKTMVFAPRYVRHVISAPKVRMAQLSEKIESTSNFVVMQTLHMQPTQCLATGVYRDTWQRVDDVLKLKVRRAVFDSELVPNSLIYPL